MAEKCILIHNPRCSKSREVKEILIEQGIDFEIIDYLKDGFKEKLLTHLPHLLGLKFSEMIREKEAIFSELKLNGKKLSDKEWIEVLMKHPILLERPIVIYNKKAVIGRPAEMVKSLFQ